MNTSWSEVFFREVFKIVLKCLPKTHIFEANFLPHLECLFDKFVNIALKNRAGVWYIKGKSNSKNDQKVYEFWLCVRRRLGD